MAQPGSEPEGTETWVHCDLRIPDGAGGGKGVTTEPEDNKEREGSFIQGGKSQACGNNTGRNTFQVSFLRRALCGWQLSWQVFDAEIITVGKDKASPLSLGRGRGSLSGQVSGI